MNLIPFRVRNRAQRWWFDRLCAGIYQTPPVACDPRSEVVIVSQLYHPDMTMYLLAAKSFTRWIKPRSFVIVDDGLTASDRQVLQHHLSHVRFVASADVPAGGCPRGGCWERLLTVSDTSESAYTIQLDSDTLTLDEPTEVLACVAQRRSFTLGTDSGTHFVPFEEAARWAGTRDQDHIQVIAEVAMAQHPDAQALRYVRGCAGFTGFAQGELPRAHVESFSGILSGLLGEAAWRSWGTEQVTSNVMVANTRDGEVLPVARYPFYTPKRDTNHTALVHFFGSYRFLQGTYARLAKGVIADLNRAA